MHIKKQIKYYNSNEKGQQTDIYKLRGTEIITPTYTHLGCKWI